MQAKLMEAIRLAAEFRSPTTGISPDALVAAIDTTDCLEKCSEGHLVDYLTQKLEFAEAALRSGSF